MITVHIKYLIRKQTEYWPFENHFEFESNPTPSRAGHLNMLCDQIFSLVCPCVAASHPGWQNAKTCLVPVLLLLPESGPDIPLVFLRMENDNNIPFSKLISKNIPNKKSLFY